MKSLPFIFAIFLGLLATETIGFCLPWQRPKIGFSFGCGSHLPSSRPSRSVLVRDTDKEATSPFTTEKSPHSPPTWPLFSISRNGTKRERVLNSFPATRLGNETLLPLELQSARIPSFSSFTRTSGRADYSPSSSLSSWERALEQVHALIDLYGNNTSHQDSISADVVMTAVKSLIHRQRADLLRSTSTLCRLEDLVWRLRHLHLRPTRWLLEETWNLQQLDLQQQSQKQQLSHRYCHSLVERQAKLLLYWVQWSQQEQEQLKPELSYFDSGLRPPPPHYVMSTWQLAVRTNASVSPSLWALYELLQHPVRSSIEYKNNANTNKTMCLPREYYSTVLRLALAVSPSHASNLFRVLQDMERLYQDTGRSFYRPTASELQGALEIASRNGNATEAAWLFQMLLTSHDNVEDISSNDIVDEPDVDKVGYWRWLLLQAIRRSTNAATNAAAVAMYAQRLLAQWEEIPQCSGGTIIPPHRDHYHQLLQMWETSQLAGAGRSAEALYHQRIDQNVTTLQTTRDAKPMTPALALPCLERLVTQDESIHQVVLAYLREMPPSFQNIRNADHFVRTSILTRPSSYQQRPKHQRQHSESERRLTHNSELVFLPTIEAILAAYFNLGLSEPKASVHAERLFRFLLIQHRNGRTEEEPNPTHLKYVMSLAKDSPDGDVTCVELFRLVSTLAKSQFLSRGPDGDNICQLLTIMSDSGKSGYSTFAREIFQWLVLSKPPVPDDQMKLAARHVTQCLQHEKAAAG